MRSNGKTIIKSEYFFFVLVLLISILAQFFPIPAQSSSWHDLCIFIDWIIYGSSTGTFLFIVIRSVSQMIFGQNEMFDWKRCFQIFIHFKIIENHFKSKWIIRTLQFYLTVY